MPDWKRELIAIAGERGYLDRPEDLRLYEYDGGVDKGRPDIVVFPRSAQQVSQIVKVARRHGVPLVGRGAGTGLSGGAIPRQGGILVSFARMNRILEIDPLNERAVVEPGVVNSDISAAAAPYGCFYAPDPSSQRACTIGGKRGGKRRRPPYAGLRRHGQSCARPRNRVAGRGDRADRRLLARRARLRSDRPRHRQRGRAVGLVTKIIVRLMRRAGGGGNISRHL
jgi:hypothetical protein